MTGLHVLSYNIHKGFSLRRRFVLAHIKEAIRLVHADMVFLQEVLGENCEHAQRIPSWPRESQFEFLADEVWPHYSYGKNAVYESGHHGNAILSKHKIVESENIDISAHRFESRGMLHAQVFYPRLKYPLHCVCIHMGLTKGGRDKQVRRLIERIEQSVPPQDPLIIAGDFNDWSLAATQQLQKYTQVEEVFKSMHGKHARTYPSRFPVLKLDRIYCRGFNIKEARVLRGKPWNALSDHSAICARLEFTQSILRPSVDESRQARNFLE